MSLAALARSQQRQRAPLRDQQRRGEVVDLHPLLAGTPSSPAAPRGPARRGRAPAAPAIASRAGRRPAAAGRRSGAARSVTVRVDSGRSVVCTQPEAQVRGQPVDHGPGDRPALVLGGRQQVGRDLLDLAEVVVLPAHPLPQLGVGPPGLLRGGRPLGLHVGERPVQADQRLQRLGRQPRTRPHGRDVQRLEAGGALRLLQLDLQRGPAARAARRSAGRPGRCPAPPARAVSSDSFASRLPFSISDSADGADRRDAGDVGQRLALALAEVPEPPADGQRIRRRPGSARRRWAAS